MDSQDHSKRWPLIGREREIITFESSLMDQNGMAFMIYGPAGVGKSRLAEECLTRASSRGFAVGQAIASSAASAVPLGAIAHLLPTGTHLHDPVTAFSTAHKALIGTGKSGSMLLIDDLHLLDATSAVLLRQLMASGAVRLIATIRSDQSASDAVATFQAEGEKVHRSDLSELNEAEVEALLERVLGGTVGRRTVHDLFAASGGNILYLHELVLAALENGAMTHGTEVWEMAPGLVPSSPKLVGLIQARLSGARTTGRVILELLSLCGPVGLEDAEALGSMETLTELERIGLIHTIQSQRRTDVSLAHPLYGEVLRAGIPDGRRQQLLVQQASAIERRGARRRGDPLHVASMRLAATGTADPSLLTQAAILARGAHDYGQVVALLDALPAQHHNTSTLLLKGEALFELGETEQANLVLLEADTPRLPEQEKVAVTFSRTLNLFWGTAQISEALQINRDARKQVTSNAGIEVLKINEGYMLTISGHPSEGTSILQEALKEDASQASDISSWLMGMMMKSTGLSFLGRNAEAIHAAEIAYQAHLSYNDQASIQHPASQKISLTLGLAEAGRLADALRTGESAIAELIEAKTLIPRVWAAFMVARTEWLAGNPASARRWYAESAALARTHRQSGALYQALTGLAASAAALGEIEESRSALEESSLYSSMGLFMGEGRLGEAWYLAAQGQMREARDVLIGAVKMARETGHVNSEGLLLTELARLGGADLAAARLADLAAVCDGDFTPARAHFAAASANGDGDQLVQASDELEQVGANLVAAEAASLAAQIYSQTGRKRSSTAARLRANRLAAKCPGAVTPGLTAGEAPVVLTRREIEVALLAAAGNSSKEIAAALTLSIRTIDNHLLSIYNKLGVKSRSELSGALKMDGSITAD
ncbi:LuxR C-terminal-related transcriptional regulator [Streptomyces virginiae]|uniref:LuxR C-terminal-related transcriptional regulator n=1 Tax=Streptomyces virginiae TaxID=1961 RepID=UPI0036847415